MEIQCGECHRDVDYLLTVFDGEGDCKVSINLFIQLGYTKSSNIVKMTHFHQANEMI